MNHRRLALFAALLLTTGCASNRNLRTQPIGPHAQRTAGYSLLYDVASDEAGVDGIFILRSAGEPTKAVVRDIAAAAQKARADLETFSRQTPSLRLDAADLPDAEVAARQIIADRTRNALLFGGDFERSLLLSQADATRYMAALAQHLADLENDDEREAMLKDFSQRMNDLHDRVVARLTVAEQQPTGNE